MVRVPSDWWGFAPEFPPGAENRTLNTVLLRRGKIIAEISWTASPGGYHARWIDVSTGAIIVHSETEHGFKTETIGNFHRRMGVVEALVYPKLRANDGTTFQSGPWNDWCGCDWPTASTFEKMDASGTSRYFKLLKRFDQDQEFHLVNTDLCPRFKYGPPQVKGHFQALNVDFLLNAPNDTFIARLAAPYTDVGYYLVRFREDLSSPFLRQGSDLALVDAGEEEQLEAQGAYTAPESRFRLLDDFFSRVRSGIQ